MNFSTTPLQLPQYTAACLAVITIGSDGPRHSAMMGLGVDPSAQDRVDLGMSVRTVYWRAQVAINDGNLIIAPQHNPPNPVLNHRPVASSETAKVDEKHDTSTLAGKIAHLFHHDHAAPEAKPLTGFPGVVDGKPLAGITVPISRLDGKHLLVETEPDAFLQIPVAADDPRQQATLRFEFDDWLSSRGEAEILGTKILAALNAETPGAQAPGAEPALAQSAPFSQAATRAGRDNDGSTHPSGDGQYKEGWQETMRGNW